MTLPSVPHVTHVAQPQERQLPGTFRDRQQIIFVTHQIEDGVDPDFVRRQAGHTYQSTTAIYSGVSTDFMNTMMRKALDTAFATDEERQR
jgi:site-specific recombinase XerD